MPQPRQPNTAPGKCEARLYRWDTSSQFVDIVDIYTLTKEAPPPGGVDIAPYLDIRCYALIARVTQLQRGAGAGSAMQHKASPRTEWELQEKGKSGLWKKGLKILRLQVSRHHMLLVLVFILLPLQFPPSPRPRHRPRPLCNTARTFAGDFPSLQAESRDFITPASSYHLIRCSSSSSVLPHFYVCRSKT